MNKFFDLSLKECLLKRGINIDDKNLFNNPKYKELKSEYINCPVEMFVTVDYYIEKYLLSQEQINKMKQGYFDINVDKKLQLERITASDLYEEIFYEDILGKSQKEADKCNMERIRQKVEGTKSGLKLKLKKSFNFDFNKFEGQEYEKLKLIKLLYRVHEKNSRLYDVLGNPSLEGVDNTVLNYESVYGNIIALLKNEVMKEVDKEFIRNGKYTIYNVCKDWEIVIQSVYLKLFDLDKKLLTDELDRIDKFMSYLLYRLPDIKEVKVPYKHSLFETFYLKLLQYENLGRQKDLHKINSYNPKIDVKISDVYMKEYQKILETEVEVNRIEEYINVNIDKIVELVYMSKSVSEEEKEIVLKDKTIEMVKSLIEMWKRNTTANMEEFVSLIIIVSCIQEIINASETKEEYNIKYYGWKTECNTLISKLKNGTDTRDAYQILWVRKVKQRMYNNLGLNKQLNLATSIEKNIDKIIEFIIKYYNISDMLEVHTYFLKKVERSILNNSDFIIEIEYMSNYIYNKTEFVMEVAHKNVFNYFKEIKTTRIGSQVIQKMIDEIKELENKKISSKFGYNISKEYRLEIELSDINNENPRDFMLLYKIDIDNKYVSLNNFFEIKSDDYIERIEELGLTAFCKKIKIY